MHDMQDVTPPQISVERQNEVKKASFWISQLFILLATVSGVYLAANQGFKQAVEFENMNTYKDTYYLQKSLQNELQDNIIILQKYMEKVQDGAYFGARNEPLNFYSLVWENMKFSPTTLSAAPEVLRDAQRFYREVARIHQAVATGNMSIPNGIKYFQEEINIINDNTIPMIEKSNASIKVKLDDTNVVL
ncbi:hypothetical protein [Zophobihabitans entericus]|uniref:Uncharacterized protein n=1 Tax=Zophobihabitans entericus TaxID=1635327 RepID=A0A6G9I7R8_9GAMM|nr:hypothetical protein [Zophobihabitans entericus]QIQ20253.1 hypothetical protein IPMB12_00285 [Zophobihabitans entericus]